MGSQTIFLRSLYARAQLWLAMIKSTSKITHTHARMITKHVALVLGPSKYLTMGCLKNCVGRLKFGLNSQDPTVVLRGLALLSDVL